jgi:hypothetical protein
MAQTDAPEGARRDFVRPLTNASSMSLMGHFRPIQRGFAMSGYPPETDVGTAGIYDTP